MALGSELLLFLVLLLSALAVLFTCIWKVAKLIAKYKIESRLEELEQMSAEERDVIMSPKEIRHLRRLSVLAGLDRKWSKSSCRQQEMRRRNLQPQSDSIMLSNETSIDNFADNAHLGSKCQHHRELQLLQQRREIVEQREYSNRDCMLQPVWMDKLPNGDIVKDDELGAREHRVVCAVHGQPRVQHDEEEEEEVTDLSSVPEAPPAPPPPTSSSSSSPPSEPPVDPTWFRCLNPSHFHPTLLRVPPHHHVHHCSCGASFPSTETLCHKAESECLENEANFLQEEVFEVPKQFCNHEDHFNNG